jgi:hypothetical protein
LVKKYDFWNRKPNDLPEHYGYETTSFTCECGEICSDKDSKCEKCGKEIEI